MGSLDTVHADFAVPAPVAVGSPSVYPRRRDAGWGLPFLGVFIYLITQNQAMAERNMEQARVQRARFDDQVRSAADSGGAAAEIQKAKELLDSGAISQAEFDALKHKALA